MTLVHLKVPYYRALTLSSDGPCTFNTWAQNSCSLVQTNTISLLSSRLLPIQTLGNRYQPQEYVPFVLSNWFNSLIRQNKVTVSRNTNYQKEVNPTLLPLPAPRWRNISSIKPTTFTMAFFCICASWMALCLDFK